MSDTFDIDPAHFLGTTVRDQNGKIIGKVVAVDGAVVTAKIDSDAVDIWLDLDWVSIEGKKR